MKIVVIGGTGLIGSKTVAILPARAATRSSPPGLIAASTPLPARGSKRALTGAQVVIDLANSPSFEDKAVLEFFETSEQQPSSRPSARRASATMSRYR